MPPRTPFTFPYTAEELAYLEKWRGLADGDWKHNMVVQIGRFDAHLVSEQRGREELKRAIAGLIKVKEGWEQNQADAADYRKRVVNLLWTILGMVLGGFILLLLGVWIKG